MALLRDVKMLLETCKISTYHTYFGAMHNCAPSSTIRYRSSPTIATDHFNLQSYKFAHYNIFITRYIRESNIYRVKYCYQIKRYQAFRESHCFYGKLFQITRIVSRTKVFSCCVNTHAIPTHIAIIIIITVNTNFNEFGVLLLNDILSLSIIQLRNANYNTRIDKIIRSRQIHEIVLFTCVTYTQNFD